MIEELMAHLLGIDADENWDDLEDLFYEQYRIGITEFDILIRQLLPMCMTAQSPLTNKTYCGFADKANLTWIIKTKEEAIEASEALFN